VLYLKIIHTPDVFACIYYKRICPALFTPRFIYVKLKDRKHSLRGKNDHNALCH